MIKSGSVVVFAKGYLPDDGGIERYSREMAISYKKLYERVYVITQCSDVRSEWNDEGVHVLNVGVSGGQLKIFLRMFQAWSGIRGEIKNIRFVHATTWRLALPYIFCFRSRAWPLVTTVHGREILIVPTLLMPLLRYVFKASDVLAFVSPSIKNIAAKISDHVESKHAIVWNGLTFTGSEKRAPVGSQVNIYTFCRLVERKNVERAILAVIELHQAGYENIKYKIAGSGPLLDSLRKLVVRHHATEYIELLGRIHDDDVSGLYEWADIFLHPQIAADSGKDIEGFGLTIADSMAYGAAVIVGRDGGPADFVVDKETGLIVDGNSASEIVSALQYYMEDVVRMRCLGENSRKWALRNLSWDISRDSILKKIQENPL